MPGCFDSGSRQSVWPPPSFIAVTVDLHEYMCVSSFVQHSRGSIKIMEVMKARLQKEGIRLDLTAPFGEPDPVRGVLLAARG